MQSTNKLRAALIRPAKRSEAVEVSALIATSFASFERHLPAPLLKLYIENSCDVAGRWNDSQVMVVESAGCIAGTVSYYADAGREGLGLPPGWAGFRTLAVHPSLRDRGLGRMLAEWCVETARRQGAPTIGIHTAAFMRAACGLYERMGFQRCPQYDLQASKIFDFDTTLGDELVMACSLPLSEWRTARVVPLRTGSLFFFG